MYELRKLYIETSSYRVRTKVLTNFSCNLLTSKCIGIFLSPSCIYVWKYESCMLKTTQVIVSESKGWQSSVVTLTMYRYLSLSILLLWMKNIKAVYWKLLKLLCQNQSIDKVQLWPWPLDLKMYRYLPLTIQHLVCTPKGIGIFFSPFYF